MTRSLTSDTTVFRDRPKRVLMCADTFGGIWTYALELSRGLSIHGIEVGLATMGAPLTPAQWKEINALPRIIVFESSYKLEWMRDPWADVKSAGKWLLELENQFAPDIVHLNSYSHGALPWHTPTIVAGHSCVFSWWRAVHRCDPPAEWDRYCESVMAGLHGADLIIGTSQTMLSKLNELYGPFKSTLLIPNGRSPGMFQPQFKHEFIFSASRVWDETKNISALGKVGSRLCWPIFLAGDQPGQSEPGKEEHKFVYHLGHLASPELFRWFERAPIYALPARYEPFGFSALEAGLAGCALVLGDIPSLREIWGDAALFVDPDDPEALERILARLIDNPNELAQAAAKARGTAQQYTVERMIDGYLAAYARVIRDSSTTLRANPGRPQQIPVTSSGFSKKNPRQERRP